MSRVLLLNPPGTRNYIRDYFCSKLSKSYYKSPPATMLMLSGLLASEHELTVIDAIAENLTPEAAVQRATAALPEAVVTLVGAASWDEDRGFLLALKNRTQAYVVAIGDVLLEDTEARLREAPGIDAALLNFSTPDVLALIPRPRGRAVANAVYRRGSGRDFQTGRRTRARGEFQLPCPRHDLFPLRRYRFPFAVGHPMSVVLTDYGCPYPCSFCVIQTLGFGVRPVKDVLAELRTLKALGVREVFFIDQTFGAKKERALELCRALAGPEYSFSWSCFSRADVTPPEVLRAMARAGCHTIIYGVESGSDETLRHYHKKLDQAQMRHTFSACRRAGIRVAATFMLGLPGEDESRSRDTLKLALRLPLDFAAFNVAVPRAGTDLRQQAIESGLIGPDFRTMDQSGLQGAMGTPELPAEKILALRREAVRRFYLRPGYWLRRLLGLRSWWDFKTQIADGFGLLLDMLGRGRES